MNTLGKMMTVAAMTCTLAGAARADIITGTITADNHYSLYASVGNQFTYHGGNELGAGGSPGTYNWSLAESYAFEGGDTLYIAAWSDDAVAQGVLAEFHSSAFGSLLSGDLRWQVYGTGVNRGDGDPHPSAAEIAGYVGYASANHLWEAPFVGGTNGIAPWGTIAGISGNARWMWNNIPGDPDPLHGGSSGDEMLIFRFTESQIPAPGGVVVLGAMLPLVLRRKR